MDFKSIHLWNVVCFTLTDGITFFALGYIAHFFTVVLARGAYAYQRLATARELTKVVDDFLDKAEKHLESDRVSNVVPDAKPSEGRSG